jgi:hypothetical protein
LAAVRFAAVVALVLGLTACSVISTLIDGWKYAKAVEADLEVATGVKPRVGFDWQNGRLLSVTVLYPQLYESKPLAALAEIVRRSVESHFQQKPEDVVLSFSLGRTGSGTTAQVERRMKVANNELNSARPREGGDPGRIPAFAGMSGPWRHPTASLRGATATKQSSRCASRSGIASLALANDAQATLFSRRLSRPSFAHDHAQLASREIKGGEAPKGVCRPFIRKRLGSFSNPFASANGPYLPTYGLRSLDGGPYGHR